jgi:hypothetical protein
MKSKILEGIIKPATVVFNDKRHTYQSIINDEFYTSCTTVAEAWKKDFVGPWYAKETVTALGWYDVYQSGTRKKRPVEAIAIDKLRFEQQFEQLKQFSAGDYFNLLTKAKKAAPEKGDLAKAYGVEAHDLIQNRIESKIDNSIKIKPSSDIKEVINAVNSFVAWEPKQDIEWLATEEVVSSDKYKIAGRVDSLCNYNKLATLSDIKTSGQISVSYLLQLAGYHIMLTEMGWTPRQWLIMRTPKDGSNMDTLTINNLDDMNFFIETFLHQREAHKFYTYMESKYQDENGKMKTDKDKVDK